MRKMTSRFLSKKKDLKLWVQTTFLFFNSSLSYLSEFKSGYLAGVIFPNSIFPYFSKASVADHKDAAINFKSKQTLVKDIDSVASFSYYTCCLNITVCFSECDAPTV